MPKLQQLNARLLNSKKRVAYATLFCCLPCYMKPFSPLLIAILICIIEKGLANVTLSPKKPKKSPVAAYR